MNDTQHINILNGGLTWTTNDGPMHRADGPVYERPDGHRIWSRIASDHKVEYWFDAPDGRSSGV